MTLDKYIEARSQDRLPPDGGRHLLVRGKIVITNATINGVTFGIGDTVAFTYTRQTGTETGKTTGTMGEITTRTGRVVEFGTAKKTGADYARIDCGDTYRGEPMPKMFTIGAMTEVTVK